VCVLNIIQQKMSRIKHIGLIQHTKSVSSGAH